MGHGNVGRRTTNGVHYSRKCAQHIKNIAAKIDVN